MIFDPVRSRASIPNLIRNDRGMRPGQRRSLSSANSGRVMSDSLKPIDLVEGLHRGDEDDRDRLRQLCLGPIGRLVDRVIADHRPDVERRLVVHRTLHWVEMYLRSRSPASFEDLDTRAFLAMILASAYMMLTPPGLDGP